MIFEILNINPEYCTRSLADVFHAAFMHAMELRSEYITPEHFLYAASTDPQFVAYCKSMDADILKLRRTLSDYLTSLDRVPKDDMYDAELSFEGDALRSTLQELESMNGGLAACYKTFFFHELNIEPSPESTRTFQMPLTVADLLEVMSEEHNSLAQYWLELYVGSKDDGWIENLFTYYTKEVSDFVKYNYTGLSAQDSPSSSPSADAGVAAPAPHSLLAEFIESANEFFSGLDVDDDTDDDRDDNHDDASDRIASPLGREPWEELVSDIHAAYPSRTPLVGREAELSHAVRVLCRKEKNNPLFIGEPGVGKTALIYGLARLIDEGRVPPRLQHQHIYGLDMGSVVAGSSYHGEFEKRMKAILDGAQKKGNCIIYIDELHTAMASAGGNASINAADLLKPYLESGAVRFIGCTTYQDYNRHIAKDKAIARRFQQIDIKEPTTDETCEILFGLRPFYEKHHGVKFPDDTIRYAVTQSAALIHDRNLPDKALDIIDEAGAWLQQNPLLKKNGERKANRYQVVSTGVVDRVLTDVCRIDAKILAAESTVQLRDLDLRIMQDIYGQDHAICQVVQSVMMSKAGLVEPGKPVASLLFVGPTGVGKTEVCRVMAREMGMELVRFDMSEYTEKHTVSKLIGSPAGYIGYDDGGLLTDAIRKTPNCVLLLDEIEKAHSDIYNILLQVMDYGRLTDSKGEKADFRNVILVMTSNAGAQHAAKAAVGFAGGQSKGQAMLDAVKKTFKPEFLNRLSATVVFNDIDRKMASLILDRKLRELSDRLASKNVTLALSDDARSFLLDKGFSPMYGAREIDRCLQQHLTPLLMREILFGKLAKGGTANVTLYDGALLLA